MFGRRFHMHWMAATAAALLLFTPAPSAAQYRGGQIRLGSGGYSYGRGGYYPGSSRGYYAPGYSSPGYYSRGYSSGYYPGSYYSGNSYYATPYSSSTYAPVYSYSAPATVREAFYPPVENTAVTPDTSQAATIQVRVPPDAELWFEGSKTSQTGSSRTFVSPALTPGRDFTYDIRARWMDNGREMVQARRISVRAGAVMSVDFNVPAPPDQVLKP